MEKRNTLPLSKFVLTFAFREALEDTQMKIFGSESERISKRDIGGIIKKSISKLEISLKEPLTTSLTLINKAFLSLKQCVNREANHHFMAALNGSIRAFNYAKENCNFYGMCLSTKFWIFCDIAIGSFDEDTCRFSPLNNLGDDRRRRCYERVKKDTENLLEHMTSQRDHMIYFDIMAKVWPLLMQFWPNEDIPPFTPWQD